MRAMPLPRSLPLRLGLPMILAGFALYGLVSLSDLLLRWGSSIAGVGLFLLWSGIAFGIAVRLLRRPPSRLMMVAMLGLILAARIGVGLCVVGRVSPGDPDIYPVIARHLLAGGGLYFDQADMGGRVFALYPPLYPLLLAGWGGVAGFSVWSLVVLNLVVDAGAAWLVVRIGRQIGAPAAGLAAAWLYLVWPSTLFSAPLAQKEGLALLLVLALAHLWMDRAAGAERTAPKAAMLGLAAGLLALTQPGWLPLAALFGMALAGRIGWRGVIGFGLRGALVAALVMLPWWARNWLVFGRFVPLTSAGGIGLWIGNNADATGNWMLQPAALRGLPELDYAQACGRLAIDWIKGHPVDFVRLTIAKLLRAIGIGQFGPYRLLIMAPPIPDWLAALLFPLSHGGQLVLLAGGAIATRAWRAPGVATAALLAAACFAQLFLFGVWFEFGERHRELLTPFLLLLIAAALAALGNRGARRAG